MTISASNGGVKAAGLSHEHFARSSVGIAAASGVVTEKNDRSGIPSAVTDSTEWLSVTLSCIGDGVITTDRAGRVTFLNPVAVALTGWSLKDALAGEGESIERVFRIVNETTRKVVENPTVRALQEGVKVGLANHTILISRDGTERPIDDSAAPIQAADGATAGAVLVFRDVTDQKRQEKLVTDAFEYASNILETQREAFLVLDKALRVVSANGSFYRAFRETKETTENNFVYDLGDGQWNISKLRELLEDVLPRRRAFESFEVEHDFPGGVGQKTMLMNARRIRKPGDDSELILLAIEDITERRAQEKLARDAFEYASNILETQREPFLVLDRDLRVVSANRAFYKAFGVEQDTTENRFVYDLGEGQWNIPRLRELLEDVLPRDHSFEGFEVEHDFARGVGYKVLTLNARRVRKPGNYSELILLGIEDITEGRQAKAAEVASELRYRRLFETAKDGILILDAESGKITDANAFMCGLTGRERKELLGKELYEIGMYKDVDENKAAFCELQRTGYLRHDHLPVQNKRGGTVEVEFVANVYTEGSKLVAQCNVRDISERSRLEKKIAKQAEALVEQSTRKDEFLAMLSHELRNPLAPIRAAVHLLKLHGREGGDPVQRQAREIIERQVANLTKLVSDLMEVSRVVSGRIRLDLLPVDIKQVVRHALQTTAPHFEQHRHSVKFSCCDEPVWASADPTRLEEVLVNLLHNAAKYTPEGGSVAVDCEIGVATEDVTSGDENGSGTGKGNGSEQQVAVVRVRDNGVGIEKELLPRIFDLFTQADRSLARSAGGLGVGLSLAHRLVQLHGGTIDASSDGPGRGSVFVVKIPLLTAKESVAAVADNAVKLTEKGGAVGELKNGGGTKGLLRVLVVDDNLDMVQMLSSVLEYKGFNVRAAYSGPEGLELAKQWLPDVVLLDIGLPGLDGYEVAKRLRAHAALSEARALTQPKMKLLALTGYGAESDIALAREAGFDGHLVKPCHIDELVSMIVASVSPM